MRRLLLVASLFLLGPGSLSGCGNESTSGNAGSAAGSGGSGGSGGSSSSSGGASAGGTGGETLITTSAAIGPVTATPGGEDTVCIHTRMGNVDGGLARRIRGTLTDGSHHMIVYLSGEEEEQLEPEPCGGFSGIFNLEGGIPGLDSTDIPIFISQKHDEQLQLPMAQDSGLPLGIRIEPNQMLRIELHWFNTTPQEQQVTGKVAFDMLPEGADAVEAGFAFWGSAALDIPPQSDWQTPVLFQRALTESTAFAVTTHQHQTGTRMRIWHSDTTDIEGKQLLADGQDWAEPPLEMLDQHITFQPGEGLAYQCEYRNPTSERIGFGEGFNEEMCFLWMYYYPNLGFDLCMHFDEGATGGVCNHLVR